MPLGGQSQTNQVMNTDANENEFMLISAIKTKQENGLIPHHAATYLPGGQDSDDGELQEAVFGSS